MANGIPPLLSQSPPPMSKIDYSDDEGDNDDNGSSYEDYESRNSASFNSAIENYNSDSCKENNQLLKDSTDNYNKPLSILNCIEQIPKNEVVSYDICIQFNNANRSELNNTSHENFVKTDVSDRTICDDIDVHDMKMKIINDDFTYNKICRIEKEVAHQNIESITNKIVCSTDLSEISDNFANTFKIIDKNFVDENSEQKHNFNIEHHKKFVEIDQKSSKNINRNDKFNENDCLSFTTLHNEQTNSILESKMKNITVDEQVCAIFYSSSFSCSKQNNMEESQNTNNEVTFNDTKLEQNEIRFTEFHSSFSSSNIDLKQKISEEIPVNILDNPEYNKIDSKAPQTLEQSAKLENCFEYTNESIETQTESDSMESIKDKDDYFFFEHDTKSVSTQFHSSHNEKKDNDNFMIACGTSENDNNKIEINFADFITSETYVETGYNNNDDDDFSDFVSPMNFLKTKVLSCELQTQLQLHQADNKISSNFQVNDSNQLKFDDINSNNFTTASIYTYDNDDDNVNNDNNNYINNNNNDVNRNHDMNSELKLPLVITSNMNYWNDIFQIGKKDEIEVNVNTIEGKLNSSTIWCKIKDVETSAALNYNWNDSESNKILLSTLAVDSRNILFGPRWNSEVPRFASNLRFTPLVPEKAFSPNSSQKVTASCENQILIKDQSIKENVEISSYVSIMPLVPDAHFDWSNSGLTNPLDNYSHSFLLDLDLLATFDMHSPHYKKSCKTGKTKTNENSEFNYSSFNTNISNIKEISQEALDILNNLPNLNVMEKQYIVFPVH